MTRLPIRTDGLHVTILYDEPRLLLIPLEHRLAGKESVTLQDIADEPMPRLPDAAWNAYWRIDPRPDGSPAPDGPLVEAIEDKIELIAAGQAVAIIPAGVQTVSPRPDLTTVPLHDVAPSHVVLATAPATTAAWWRPSANPPRPSSAGQIAQGSDPLDGGVEGGRAQLPAVQGAGQGRGDRALLLGLSQLPR